MKHDWQHTVKPQKKRNWRKEEDEKKQREFLEKESVERYNKDVQGVVINNLYREKYGLPTNLEVREPDRIMKLAVRDSYVAERTKRLQQYSLDPNLVFFHHELEDAEIGW